MIPATEISAWRALAPWSSDVQVEQDYLLCRAVAAVFEDRFLSSQVAMRGGTVLHKELARRMQSRKFLRDLEGYLPIGMDYDPQAAYATFCEIFLPHLDASV